MHPLAVLQAAPEVAAAHHDAHLHTLLGAAGHHAAHLFDHVEIQAAALFAAQRLAADLQQHALVSQLAHGSHPLPFQNWIVLMDSIILENLPFA